VGRRAGRAEEGWMVDRRRKDGKESIITGPCRRGMKRRTRIGNFGCDGERCFRKRMNVCDSRVETLK
jgi:hypothetical protein